MTDVPGRFIGEQPPEIPQQEPVQQAAPTPFPSAMNAMVQEERVKNFISQTSPTDTLERINYILKGFIYDETAREWVKVAEGVPEQVRLDFLQFITTDLSEDVRMTRLGQKQINGIMESSIEWILDYLDIYADDHEIQEEQMSKIAWMMIKVIFYAVLRAENGIERGKMYGSLTMSGSPDSVPNTNQQGKKWFQFWK